MATTQSEISRWLARAKNDGATHVIVACDTFDYDDYPIYVMPGQDIRAEIAKAGSAEMTRVMEVYNMSKDIQQQLNERRSFNL